MFHTDTSGNCAIVVIIIYRLCSLKSVVELMVILKRILLYPVPKIREATVSTKKDALGASKKYCTWTFTRVNSGLTGKSFQSLTRPIL